MFISALPSGPFDTNAYVVGCPDTHQAAIIDPAPESSQDIIDTLSAGKWTPTKILLTHSHWDHIGDVHKLHEYYHIPVYIHELDAPNLEVPGSDGLPCWIFIKGVKPDGYFKEGDEIEVGNIKFQVIDTPGHTPGGVCFYCPKEKVLISGDTLFKGSIGNLSFNTARPKLMWSSLDKLAALPADTKVYPGHGPDTTIGKESWLPNARQLFGD